MKKLFFLLIGLLLSLAGFSQSCLPEGIKFDTQAKINNFQVNYPGCSEIEGDVEIYGSNIDNLHGLSGLTSIGGGLQIHFASNLPNLNGLENLSFIGGDLDLFYNHDLINFTELENLNSIGGDLIIEANEHLTSISGLKNIDPESIENLTICRNESLSSCEIQCLCEYLANPAGKVLIYNNAEGCNNPPEVANACGFAMSCLPYGDYLLYNQYDIDNFQTNYSNCTQLQGNVTITGDDITNLNGMNSVSTIAGNFEISDNPLITNLLGLENLISIGGYLTIFQNVTQTSLSGLNMLGAIGADFEISGNPNLLVLTGLDSLNSIGGNLIIYGNYVLTSLAGMNSLSSVNGRISVGINSDLKSLTGLDNIDASSIAELKIYNNDSLTTCEVQSVCDYLASPNGTIEIHDNAPGCNSQAEVEAACEVGIDESAVSGRQPAVKISPNPSSSFLTIMANLPYSKFQISIFNLNGQEVMSRQIAEHKAVIDISHLPGGVYFVRMTGENAVSIQKFIKID
jgi:hypothetical protein